MAPGDREYVTPRQQTPILPSVAIQAERLFIPIKDWQTRLLEIKPGSFGEPLRADLHIVDLVHGSCAILHDKQLRIEYEALSYCWGDGKFTQCIECNAVPYPISANLYDALQRLRHCNQGRYIWIDALCINQCNLAERSMQVGNMILIYQKAKKVLAWLGERDESSDCMVQCFVAAAPRLCNSHRKIVCKEVLHLLSRPWFRRVWVKQEVWAANDIDVLFGDSVFPWEVLEHRAMDFLEVMESVNLSGIEGESAVPSTFRTVLSGLQRAPKAQRAIIGILGQDAETLHALVRSSRRHQVNILSRTELLSVLIRSSTAECRDLRDHVYGVLGMSGISHGYTSKAGHAADVEFVVDYQRPTAKVYADVIRYYIQRDQSLWIFNAMFDFDFRCEGIRLGSMIDKEELPSWCPDWSIPMEMKIPPWLDSKLGWGEYTSLCQLLTACPPSLMDTKWKVLQLSGLSLPGIESVEESTGLYGQSNDQPMRYFRITIQKYPQRSAVLRKRRQPDGYRKSLEAQYEKLDNLGRVARRWLAKGHDLSKNDIIVALEGSLAPFVLRKHENGSTFEFRGLARPDTEPMPSQLLNTIQSLLVAAREESVLEDFEIT